MRASPCIWLLLLLGATASAHEPDFNAFWVQPLAPIVIRGLIVPMGWTHGLGSTTDLVVELTPYTAGPGTCWGPSCRDGVTGIIASVGATFGRPMLSTADCEIGWFIGPKVLAAAAYEPGTAGSSFTEYPFIPGTSYEGGIGLDAGLEIHNGRRALYAAIVVGVQVTGALNSGDLADGPPNLPSWPIFMMSGPTVWERHDRIAPGANVNLLRMGVAF